MAKPQGAGHRGIGIGISRGHAQTMDRLAEPEDPHGLTSWVFTTKSSCSSQGGKLSDEMPEFPTIQKMPFGAFSRFKKKNIQLHTQIMVEMAPGIVHRDTSQIISNNGKDIHHNTLEPT